MSVYDFDYAALQALESREAGSAMRPPDIPSFELHRRIGRGRFGEVWLATERATGIHRAVKIIPKSVASATSVHATELNGIIHYLEAAKDNPNLLQIFDVAEAHQHVYMVMELADDLRGVPSWSIGDYQPKTLAGVIEAHQHGRIPPDEALAITDEVLSGLDALHKVGNVHRDVKPANILYVDNRVKLGDPGLVSVMDHARDSSGTVGYMPLDDRRGPARDVFAVGRLLYHMLTGWHASQFPDLPGELFVAPARVRDYRRAIRVMNKAAHPKASEAFQTASEMRRAVNEWRSGFWSWRGARRFYQGIAIGALALLAMIALIVRSSLRQPAEHAAGVQTHLVSVQPVKDSSGAYDLVLQFSDGDTTRFRPGQGKVRSALLVDFAGDGRPSLAVGFEASAPGEYAGALAVFDPSDCRAQPEAPPALFKDQLCEAPPNVFGEPTGPCHSETLWAGDLDAIPGEELIVASIHHRGSAHLAAFTRGGTRLGDYWHFGWPMNDPRARPVTVDVEGQACVAFPLIANEIREGQRRDLANERLHTALLILDAETLIRARASDRPINNFWTINEWMNRGSRCPPVAYGYVAPGYWTRVDEQDLVRLSRFVGGTNTIIALELRDGTEIELDAELDLQELRVPDRESRERAEAGIDAIWRKTWPPSH